MKIIYLHGFNSDGNGKTASKLKEAYGDLLLNPSYDYANPDRAYKQINKLIVENADNNSIIIGTSMGGFWANYFGQKFNLKTILVNPALQPSITTKKYIGENKNFSTGKIVNYKMTMVEAFKKYETPIDKDLNRVTILSINDKVIDYKTTKKLLSETKIVYDKIQGHRLENIDKVVFAIDNYFNGYINSLTEKVLVKKKLNEKFINLLPGDIEQKKRFGPEVFSMLQKSYEKVGGLAGNGFKSVDDMIKNIPMWKLVRKEDRIVCVVMYKDKNGRKRVAAGTDGSSVGKMAFKQVAAEELKTDRSYGEISGPSLAMQKNNLDTLIKHAIPFSKAQEVLGKDIKKPDSDDAEVLKYPSLIDYFYQRLIGGEWHTKLLLGKTGNAI